MYRRMPRIVPALCAILALALAVTTVGAATYTDPKGRYSVVVPDGWQAEKSADSLNVLYTGPKGRLLAFGVLATDEAIPIDSAELLRSAIDTVGDIFDEQNAFTFGSTTLGGRPAQRAEGRGHIDTEAVRLTLTATSAAGTTYILLFAAGEAEYPAAAQTERAILDSFIFLKAPVAATKPPAPLIIHRLGDG